MFQFWMNMSPFAKGLVIGGAVGVTTVVVCGVSYSFWVDRDRKGLSKSMKKMLDEAHKDFDKKSRKEGVPTEEILKAAKTLDSLNWKPEPRKNVKRFLNAVNALHNHYTGFVELSAEKFTAVLNAYKAAADSLLKGGTEEVEGDSKKEAA